MAKRKNIIYGVGMAKIKNIIYGVGVAAAIAGGTYLYMHNYGNQTATGNVGLPDGRSDIAAVQKKPMKAKEHQKKVQTGINPQKEIMMLKSKVNDLQNIVDSLAQSGSGKAADAVQAPAPARVYVNEVVPNTYQVFAPYGTVYTLYATPAFVNLWLANEFFGLGFGFTWGRFGYGWSPANYIYSHREEYYGHWGDFQLNNGRRFNITPRDYYGSVAPLTDARPRNIGDTRGGGGGNPNVAPVRQRGSAGQFNIRREGGNGSAVRSYVPQAQPSQRIRGSPSVQQNGGFLRRPEPQSFAPQPQRFNVQPQSQPIGRSRH